MRLVMIVLLLVVLPTALLSVLAGRSLQARELILHNRLEQEAIERLEAVADEADLNVREALEQVMLLFKQTVLAGTDVKRLGEEESEVCARHALVRRVFLFMNPWGFVYPEFTIPAAQTLASLSPAHRLRLQLGSLLARERPLRQALLSIGIDERLYVFSPVSGYRDLYAGLELDRAAVTRLVGRLLDIEASPTIRLALLGEDQPNRQVPDVHEDVQVRDTLAGLQEALPSGFSGGGRDPSGLLVSGRLKPPLSYMEIGAFAADAVQARSAHVLQLRLVGWGILLLAIVIIASTFVLISSALRQAETARRRSEFIAGMSHDLRTPVAAMRVLAESLSAGRVTEAARRQQFLETIVTECDRLAAQIDRVLFFFRHEQKTLRYHKRPLAINELVATVTERYRRQHADRGEIRFSPAAGNPVVKADPDAVEKAFANLLDNALKYGIRETGHDRGGRVEGDIEISLRWVHERWRTWVVLAVADHGPGIRIKERGRIFNRFYRGTATAPLHTGGVGLGLSLVADIVKAHQGRIRVAEADGGGAVFEIWLKGESDE